MSQISVQTEHIFPVIKKWLYSEKDIFLREIVSNACDACTKLKRLESLGEVHDIDTGAFRIDVLLDKAEKTITVTDNGIGMTKDEVERYITQIALSGALEFIEKYDDKNGGDGIIGHFGLGFYSSFMVSDKVKVVTKSYTDVPAVEWICGQDGNYEIGDSDKTERGTSVVMYITDEEAEYLDAYKLRGILDKYCAFMPVAIYFDDGEEHKHEHEDGKECHCDECEEKPINDTEPLWTKAPSDCTDEQYNELYKKLMHDYKDPLFHIHINADYPLNFKGILYFPKRTDEFESYEGQIKLYYNQVFVADNIKEILPEYMIMLKGVLDCPELPLNVSRSYLQNDTYTNKISKHIAKKVADKLCSMFNTEREKYEGMWQDIKTFVLYGSLRDEKFAERMKDSILFKKCDGGYVTFAEYAELAKEKHEGKVFYCTDKTAQSQYISMLEAQGITVVEFDTLLETQYISMAEQKDTKVKFLRVDAELPEVLKGDALSKDGFDEEKAKAIFAKVLPEKTEITFQSLKDENLPIMMTVSEESRRMNDMLKMYKSFGKGGEFDELPESESVIINKASTLMALLCRAGEDKANAAAKQLVALAKLSRRSLSAKEQEEFTKGSFEVLEKLLAE